jgi:ATP-binding cassette subfamily B protein
LKIRSSIRAEKEPLVQERFFFCSLVYNEDRIKKGARERFLETFAVCPEGREIMKETRKALGKKTRHSILSNIVYFQKCLYKEFPRMAVYNIVIVVCRSLAPLLTILLPGVVLAVAERGELLAGLAVIVLMGGAMMACDALSQSLSMKSYFYENVFRSILLSDAVLKQTKCLYKYVEYGEEKKITKRAYQCLDNGDYAVTYKMLDYPWELLVNVIAFCFYSTALYTLKPWVVAVLLLFSLANYGISRMRNKWQLVLRDKFAQSDREVGYLKRAFRDSGIAKDIRIFAMNDWLMAFRKKVFKERVGLEKKNNRKLFLAECLMMLLSVLRNGLAYGYLLYSCFQGDVAIAAFPVYFGAITGFSGFVTGMAKAYSDLRLANRDAEYFRSHMELPEIREGGQTPEALLRQPARIEFRDVTFSFGEQKVYDHFNLKIGAGEKVALLGINGAGKTTLIKLLCGLYEPDQGQILINGVDISTVPKRALYDLFSVVFQEATIFPYPVGCNLSMKRLKDTDEERAWNVLSRAGLGELFREKGIGMDSYMTKDVFSDGVELSGGQRQRFLLARALYKDGHILILDEPTSALDPIAESQIYQEYVNISGGRTSLFVSHRLASTRFSDRILFLEKGRVIEEGTHEELMAKGGSYAHMFEVQAHYYQSKDAEGQTLKEQCKEPQAVES